ncbi:uroporphyrinogen-III synthase [Saccharopolyspora rectivirgula]|uniref:Bifunctional uroporphyrinogen-III synthetase/response regulator domain protein n=1 Tax=Saccharopolyspora rectivirgula TaxID=28042 RepID=A0A073AW60_9PSEU|nr:uroporphyrinogen-III synthase [Saccharopolyspora rectivirgula]KEI43605.1 bifunctional uroporphyrinogen-III synthetase/response regulator domain protein [Saccharopolyspora rectivirgula]
MTDALAGYTVAVTAARRADELGSLLANRGARVVHGPALRILPLADDAELHRVSLRFLEEPPDVVVATTGIGFRGWIDAADGWGISAELLDALRPARLLARGPKARGAVRAAGLPDPWSPGSESSAELLEHLLEQDLTGVRVAVQLHGRPLPDFVDALRCAGAEVVEVPVYRWTAPADASALEDLVRSVCAREVDAVTFTSAPAAVGLLSLADELRCREELLAALRGPVLAACVGPVAHAPLADHGVPAVVPRRFRLGALVHTLCDELPRRAPTLPVAGRELQVRGHAAVVDGELKPLSPQARTLLGVLAERPGRVVPRRELGRALRRAGGSGDEHAVEQAVARLRAALGAPELVQTVIKRGYRLPLEPVRDAPRCVRS